MSTSLLPHLESRFGAASEVVCEIRCETANEPESDTATIERTSEDERLDDTEKTGDGYRVLLYNDDHTPVDAVVKQVIKATKCSLLKATKITLEAHHKGRAVCFRGSREKCQQVALVLREIRLQCEVDCD